MRFLKTKRKGFEITQGRGWASSRSGVNLLFMASLNVFRTEHQYFVLPGWEERECLRIVSFKKTKPVGFPTLAYTGRLRRKGSPFLGFRYMYKKG